MLPCVGCFIIITSSVIVNFKSDPYHVCNAIINRLKLKINNIGKTDSNSNNNEVIWINFPYLGKKGEQPPNSLIHTLKKSFKDVKFSCTHKTNKVSMFCKTKDKTRSL